MINLKQKMHDIQHYFSPKVIGEVNDVYVKLAKIKGEDVPWHNHKDEDELFYIVHGELLFEIEDKPSFVMNEGDLFIVPKGVNHRVSSTAECVIMLIENKSTQHTGDVRSHVTKSIEEQL
jgi:quercetin dioxygenase-like cupin family protein